MNPTEFLRKFEEAIEGLKPGSLRLETELAGMPQWDSLAVLTILAQIDTEYGVQISGTEIQQCRSVSDLFRVVERKVSEKKG